MTLAILSRIVLFICFTQCLWLTRHIYRLSTDGKCRKVKLYCKTLAAEIAAVMMLTYAIGIDDHYRFVQAVKTKDETIQKLAAQRAKPMSTESLSKGNTSETKNELRIAVESGSGESHAVVSEGTITATTATGTTVTWIAGRSLGPVLGTGDQSGRRGGASGIGIGRVSVGSGGIDPMPGIAGSTVRQF